MAPRAPGAPPLPTLDSRGWTRKRHAARRRLLRSEMAVAPAAGRGGGRRGRASPPESPPPPPARRPPRPPPPPTAPARARAAAPRLPESLPPAMAPRLSGPARPTLTVALLHPRLHNTSTTPKQQPQWRKLVQNQQQQKQLSWLQITPAYQWTADSTGCWHARDGALVVGTGPAGPMAVGPSAAISDAPVAEAEDAVAAIAVSLSCFGSEQVSVLRDSRAGTGCLRGYTLL